MVFRSLSSIAFQARLPMYALKRTHYYSRTPYVVSYRRCKQLFIMSPFGCIWGRIKALKIHLPVWSPVLGMGRKGWLYLFYIKRIFLCKF